MLVPRLVPDLEIEPVHGVSLWLVPEEGRGERTGAQSVLR
jgi:hypothetical protein